MPPLGDRPIFRSAGAAVLSYDNQHIAARLVHTRFPLPVRRKRKEQEMGTDTTFSAAVAAIVAHHAKLYNLLLAALSAYSGGKTPPRKERISHILNCEENDAHLLLERLATAAKAAPRGSLGEHPDILIAECRDFLDFLEEHLPSPDCAAAINETLQTEEAFVNFIKGISGADPRLSRRDYALRIDKFIRDIKASFRNLGSSIVKMEFTQFRFLQKPKLKKASNSPSETPAKRGRIGSGLHGKRTSCMEEQLSDFRNFVKDHPINENDRSKTLGARASQYWKCHEKTMNHASQCTGEHKGFKTFKSLANAFRKSKR